MPFLFQRQLGTRHDVVSPTTVQLMIRRSCEEIAETNPAFAGTKFTPHDFRRLFATDIVNGGLPIHIGAALLGHLNLQTTQGYVAVFAEDIVKHYQEFLNHRRTLRPEDEYVDVNREEWDEFEEHFDKRKVELGNCARPYGSPASTSTHASDAQCCRSTPRCCRGWPRSRRTWSSAASAHRRNNGSARSKAST
ncbi:tyrosine-type recombinase/integrase [Streptomyces zhihengii]